MCLQTCFTHIQQHSTGTLSAFQNAILDKPFHRLDQRVIAEIHNLLQLWLLGNHVSRLHVAASHISQNHPVSFDRLGMILYL
jgi:hypothetical protein